MAPNSTNNYDNVFNCFFIAPRIKYENEEKKQNPKPIWELLDRRLVSNEYRYTYIIKCLYPRMPEFFFFLPFQFVKNQNICNLIWGLKGGGGDDKLF